jgi:hypothetical protein
VKLTQAEWHLPSGLGADFIRDLNGSIEAFHGFVTGKGLPSAEIPDFRIVEKPLVLSPDAMSVDPTHDILG